LIVAAVDGHAEAVRALAELGADLNVVKEVISLETIAVEL
jgi:hypothetical protein